MTTKTKIELTEQAVEDLGAEVGWFPPEGFDPDTDTLPEGVVAVENPDGSGVFTLHSGRLEARRGEVESLLRQLPYTLFEPDGDTIAVSMYTDDVFRPLDAAITALPEDEAYDSQREALINDARAWTDETIAAQALLSFGVALGMVEVEDVDPFMAMIFGVLPTVKITI